MARFRRLTVDEARAMTRAELLDRLEIEQQYWHRKMDQHRMSPEDWEAHEVFTACLHLIDPVTAVSDTLAWLKGEGAGRYMDTRPGDDATGAPIPG